MTKKTAATKELRDKVEGAAMVGARDQDIALAFEAEGVGSERTLRTRFRKELSRGRAKGNVRLASTIWAQAMAGDKTLLIFLGKTRLGMSEIARVQPTGADGAPLMQPTQPELVIVQETLELRHHPLNALRREIERREREPDGAAVH